MKIFTKQNHEARKKSRIFVSSCCFKKILPKKFPSDFAFNFSRATVRYAVLKTLTWARRLARGGLAAATETAAADFGGFVAVILAPLLFPFLPF